MHPMGRPLWSGAPGVLAAALLLACALAACGSPPGPNAAPSGTSATTPPSSSTLVPATTTSGPGVVVPNVIGFRIAAAHAALRAVGLRWVGLDVPCRKGTLASRSVVASLSLPGKPPDVRAGAQPLDPGATVPPGTRVALTWSACFGNGSTVPVLVGASFAVARHALHAAGLTWACYSLGPTATTTADQPPTVLGQDPGVGTVVRPGTTVVITMHECPQ